MLKEPLFQNDIFEHIIKYMTFYLGYEYWFLIFCGVLLFLYLCYKFLMYRNDVSYAGNFPTEEYPFSFAQKSQVWCLAFLILCVVYNIVAIFSQEMSFFSNYDTRGSVILIFERGVVPAWGVWERFCPLAFWDTNILYAVTHHFGVINVYLSIQSLIIVWLLNYFLRFMPVCKRFLCVGLIMASPVIFSISSVIFSERLLLMYIIGSLICFQKYGQYSQKKYFLWFGILLTNFALYCKELSVLFYFGIFFYYAVSHVWNGRIVPKSFLHPLQTARKYPFEVLLILSIVCFFSLYLFHMGGVMDSSYALARQMSLFETFKRYYTEIAVSIVVVFFMFKNLFSQQKYPLIEGMAFGSVMITIFVIFILRIGQFVLSMACLPYYLTVSHVIGLVYVFSYFKNKYFYVLVCFFLALNSIVRNIGIQQNYDGTYYREVAEFIMSGKEGAKVNVFISKHSDFGNWSIRAWRLPFVYYWPNANVDFFFSGADLNTIDFFEEDRVFYKKTPDVGDYFVIRKAKYYSQDMYEISGMEADKVFENKMFEVYLIK
ncbi:MAG TPA: hypothetical protein DIC64_02295 [Alphaproteobacteria bacterium]|nr:hypothetical protein [Alphaproteobacteria bacterium]